MVEITTSTPRDAFTIAGETFNVVQPFAEGHPLSANEASALNQVFAENIRNNFAAKVKAAKESGSFDLEGIQSQLDAYQAEYSFGRRTSSGPRATDPVEAEAMSLAKAAVKKALREKGYDMKTVGADDISRLAREALAKNPKITELARQRVESAQALAGIELGVGDSAVAGDKAPAKASKSKAA